MTNNTWPSGSDSIKQFYEDNLQPAITLWKYLYNQKQDRGRPPGPRDYQWKTTLVMVYAALEAGLEDIILAAYGHCNSETGREDHLLTRRRNYLVERRLSSPSFENIEHILVAYFGIELDVLPEVAKFKARVKKSSNKGIGRGAQRLSPSDWNGLKKLLQILARVRNAVAHGEAYSSQSLPVGSPDYKGYLWVQRANGTWSVQAPHALTGIRTVISVYNTVAYALDKKTGFLNSTMPLQCPNNMIDYDL